MEKRQILKELNNPNIEEANQKVVTRMIEAEPILIDFRPAIDVIPDMSPQTIQHAGPPVEWNHRSGPQKGAIIGAALLEGLAETAEQAEELAASGKLELVPNHHRDTVGSMAGIISPSIPVWVVRNRRHGNLAYCTLETDFSFGGYDEEALKTIRWQRDVMQPIISAALSKSDGIALNPITAKGLHMGDDCHQRFEASTYVLNTELTKVMLDAGIANADILEVLRYLDEDRMIHLGVCMAASKATADVGHNIRHATIVSTIARNGTETGIRVSGLGDKWFTATPEPITELGIYFSGYSVADASLDIGDSAITETVGLGACAIAGVPTHWAFFGKNPLTKVLEAQQKMWDITVTKHPSFTIPFLDFQGTALGFDIRKVVETGYEPLLNTAIAAKDHTNIMRMIGAGLSKVPLSAFEKALQAFADKYLR